MILGIQVRVLRDARASFSARKLTNQVFPHRPSITLNAQALTQRVDQTIVLLTGGLPPGIPKAFEILCSIDLNLDRAMIRLPVEVPRNLSPVWHMHAIAMQRI